MAIPAGIIPAVGNILGGLIGRSGVSSANAANIRIARENREFQERMSSTAYTRAAKDLENAGLNRILALGSPATTPAGNLATMQNEQAPVQEGIRGGVSTALQSKRLQQEIKNMKVVAIKDSRLGALHSINYNVQERMQARLKEEIKLLKFQQPGARAEADLWDRLNREGSSAKGLLKIAPLLRLLKGN